jgi:hypothetical protein
MAFALCVLPVGFRALSMGEVAEKAMAAVGEVAEKAMAAVVAKVEAAQEVEAQAAVGTPRCENMKRLRRCS